MRFNNKGFTLVEGLLVLIAITLIAGVGIYVFNSYKDKNSDTKTVQKTSESENSDSTKPSKMYLVFKNEGVKIELNEETKDAYNGSTSSDEAYISSHYFDDKVGFEGCRVNGAVSGIIALDSAKVGDDHFGSPWTEAELKNFSDVKIGDTYYWLTPSNGPCWNPVEIQESDPRVQKLLEFRGAMSDLQKTITKI